jgi:hypothetical protein
MGSNAVEPERIYLFDATNNTPLIDYFADGSSSSNFKRNKFVFGGILERESVDPKKGIKYKLRISAHINKVLNDNSTINQNIRLGLVISENINTFAGGFFKTPITVGSNQLNILPFSSIMSPLGTVLYGSNPSVGDYDKRVKLEIYYTKSN